MNLSPGHFMLADAERKYGLPDGSECPELTESSGGDGRTIISTIIGVDFGTTHSPVAGMTDCGPILSSPMSSHSLDDAGLSIPRPEVIRT